MTEKDIWIAVLAGLPAIILAIIAWRKAPAEQDLTQASAARQIADGASAFCERLQHELDDVQAQLATSETRADQAAHMVTDLQQRLASAEARLAQSESRTAEAEKRANEFRTELIRVGTMLDQSRKQHQHQIEELVLVIQTLLEQVEGLGGKPNIDRELLDRVANLSRGTA